MLPGWSLARIIYTPAGRARRATSAIRIRLCINASTGSVWNLPRLITSDD